MSDLRRRPEWFQAMMTAKAMAFKALSAEEQEAALAEQRALRDRSKQRKADHAARFRAICSMVFAGKPVREIAAATGVTKYVVRDALFRIGLPYSQTDVNRIVAVVLPVGVLAEIEAVAEARGATLTATMQDVWKALAADGGFVLRRTMGVKQKAKG